MKTQRRVIDESVRNKVAALIKAGKTGGEIARLMGISLPSVQNIRMQRRLPSTAPATAAKQPKRVVAPTLPAEKPTIPTFAYQTYGGELQVYVGFPDALFETKYFIPDFGSEFVRNGLRPRDDDDWEWRILSKRTAEKTTSVKFGPCNHVLHVWGYLSSKSLNFSKLARTLPFETNVRAIPNDVELSFIRIRSVK